MNDFLDKAEDLLRTGQLGESQKRFEDVFAAIVDLRAVYAKAYLDLDNLEDIFGAFEMAALFKRFAERSESSITGLIAATKHMICETLVRSVRYPIDREGHVLPPPPYGQFATLVEKVNERARESQCSIITFNYDLALDYAFATYRSVPGHLDYCLEQVPKQSNTVPLLKLHGSLNWRRRDSGEVVALALSRYRYKVAPERPHDLVRLEGESPALRFPAQVAPRLLGADPVVVPPTWNKSRYQDNMSAVWARAAAELSEARTIIVCGFSLPNTDSFFRYMFALSTLSPVRIRHFWVFDPDAEVETRFRALVGPGIAPRFKYFPTTFEDAISVVSKEILGTPRGVLFA